MLFKKYTTRFISQSKVEIQMLLKGLLAILVISLSATSFFTISASAQLYDKYVIPDWVKRIAEFWVQDEITDTDFGEGLSFLIDKEIIKVPKVEYLQSQVSSLAEENSQLKSELEKNGLANPIYVYTNRDAIVEDGTVVIFGEVSEIRYGLPVKLEITDPKGELISVTQMDVNSQGKFGTFVKSGGPNWHMSGDYTVKVQYGAEYRTAETTFEFFK